MGCCAGGSKTVTLEKKGGAPVKVTTNNAVAAKKAEVKKVVNPLSDYEIAQKLDQQAAENEQKVKDAAAVQVKIDAKKEEAAKQAALEATKKKEEAERLLKEAEGKTAKENEEAALLAEKTRKEQDEVVLQLEAQRKLAEEQEAARLAMEEATRKEMEDLAIANIAAEQQKAEIEEAERLAQVAAEEAERKLQEEAERQAEADALKPAEYESLTIKLVEFFSEKNHDMLKKQDPFLRIILRNKDGKKIHKKTTKVVSGGGTSFMYDDTHEYAISGKHFNLQEGIKLQVKCYDQDPLSKDYIGKTHNDPIEFYLKEEGTTKFRFYGIDGTKETAWIEAYITPKIGISKMDTMQTVVDGPDSSDEGNSN